MENSEDPIIKKRRQANERKRRWLAKQSQESLKRYRANQPEHVRNYRERQTDSQRAIRQASDLDAHRRFANQMTPEQQEAHRVAHNLSQRRYISNMNPEQRQVRLQSSRDYNQVRYQQEREEQIESFRNEAFYFSEEQIVTHYCGAFDVICQFCNSKNFKDELSSDGKFTSCCRKGKIKLPVHTNMEGQVLKYPEFLEKIMTDNTDPNYNNFRNNIRAYNSSVSFASLGAKTFEFRGRGPYVFKVHGQTYHQTSHLLPDNDQAPQYAQLYIVDTSQANEIRMNHPRTTGLNRNVLDQIDSFFRQNNRIAQSYQMMREIEESERVQAEQRGESIPVVNMAFRRDRHSDARRYNQPTSNEVAMVFVNEDGEPPFERDIRIYPRNPQNPEQQYVSLNILSPNLDPMTYSLLFPYGEPGWQPKWQCESYENVRQNTVRKNISMLQYKSALTAIREDTFNPVMSAGNLTQQWIVDSYLQVEANNLNYVRQNQKRLRADQYKGLTDYIANVTGNGNVAAGVSVILPSSFEGSPRNMRERCCDAMAIFAKFGPPDLFITFTANPSWIEITENLRNGEQVSDRPDLVTRVFAIKLDSLMNYLTNLEMFGPHQAFVLSIEFQKRGLPHAHILLTLKPEYRFTTAAGIDQFISAEIPSVDYPKLREIVLKCMMHGPCGNDNPNATCMKDGQCTKKFPKEFTDMTLVNVNGYPLYRRRASQSVQVRGVMMDNRHVVPYNPYLTLKYNAHINVEVCTSIKSIKYIYKYIYKGYDCANIVITSEGNNVLQHNEISNFIDCRYVSSPEAMWRLRENKMHDRSHAVIRLPVHLPNHQMVYFEEGHEEEAVQEAQSRKTKLEKWFHLNRVDQDAQQWLYTEIPNHYVFERNEWKPRKRDGHKIVARMYTVSPKDAERFYLRILLLHVRGATSFESLRTVNGTIFESFKAAAIARGLLESDEEWENCLRDAGTYLMPRQLREMFAFIICFCHPAQPLNLWENNIENLTLDYTRTDTEELAKNKALHDIDAIMREHGLSCSVVGLPNPTGSPPLQLQYDLTEETREAKIFVEMLNESQLRAFNEIINSVNNPNENHLFYIDGPGGSGKTFLYKAIMSFVRGRGEVVLAWATTGIAGTLLKGGRTVHSGAKFPVPISEKSVSSLRMNSPEAEEIRKASIIIIDEVSIMEKNALHCLDRLCREITLIDKPFGGKIIVIGGDFRQTLPVVVRGAKIDILERCIKASNLWRHFKTLSLTTNMRSNGQSHHNEWLLQVGEGSLPAIPGIEDEDLIEIPEHMIERNDLIESIFGDINQLTLNDLSARIILTPTNVQTLEMNSKIIEMIPVISKTYFSADSILTEDANDNINYPIEFLNNLAPSGMPPHILKLKKGVIIMLLRNLAPKKGLCNGTRLCVEECATNFIKAKILSENNRGNSVLIPRIDLAPSDSSLPFVLKRRQFPVIPAFAITINKSQGQSFDHVGIDLKTPVFAHGQLYVALSRSKIASNIKIHIESGLHQGELLNDGRIFTKNVVYKEIM